MQTLPTTWPFPTELTPTPPPELVPEAPKPKRKKFVQKPKLRDIHDVEEAML